MKLIKRMRSYQQKQLRITKSQFILSLIVLTALLSGCATNRGIIDVRVPVPNNQPGGTALKITNVTDSRVFELKPSEASIPSLKNGEIDDKAITSRAIARKRNGYGKALGDILLPEGRTVEMLTREALTRSFREKGFQVLEPGDAGYDSAKPVEANIEQFWSWINLGFWAAKLNFQSNIHLKGDIANLKDGKSVSSSTQLNTQAAGTRAWTNILNKGIEDLVKEVKDQI